MAAVFFVTGAAFGTWAARIPGVQERLDLSTAGLGVALAGNMVGALVGLALAGALVSRLGSRRLLVGSLLSFVPVLAFVPLAPSLAILTMTLVLFGAANSGVDVGVNTQGTHVERAYERPVLSGLHAMFSLGALTAAGVAAVAAAVGLPLVIHFAVASATLSALGLGSIMWMTSEPRDEERAPRLAMPTRGLVLPGMVAFCMVFAEDVTNTWSAVYLRSVADAGQDIAAAGFAVYSAGMLIGRFIADRVVDSRGPHFTLQGGGATATAGVALAIVVPHKATSLAGLLLVGFGLAPVLPVLLSVVAHRDPPKAGSAIAAVTTVGYLGSVVGPPSVGALAEPFGLRVAFLAIPLVMVAMTVMSARLQQPASTRETDA